MIVSGVAYTATVLAMTVFLWRVFGKRFDAMDARLDRVDARVDSLGVYGLREPDGADVPVWAVT